MELLVSKGKIHLTSLFHSTVLISLFPYLALIVVIGEKQLLEGHSCQSMSCVPRNRVWACQEMEDHPVPTNSVSKTVHKFIGGSREQRELEQATNPGKQSWLWEELVKCLLIYMLFVIRLGEKKKTNCFNSVSVSIPPGRWYKVHTLFLVLSNTYLNSHMSDVLCSDIHWFCFPKNSYFFEIHQMPRF